MCLQNQIHATLETAEKLAAAKTYIENYYANLNSNPYQPGDQDYLRRLRVLKSKHSIVPVLASYGLNGHAKANLRPLRILGKGSFGSVELVREVGTNQVFAMKMMRKSAMIKNSQEAHLRCERDALVKFTRQNSRWIIPLYQSFQDSNYLYLVMSFMEGGDFLGLLLREEVLPEQDTRFYIAEMLCAVREVHKLGFIHRDLKPDNFLIDSTGHLRLSDFGLAFSPHWSHQMSYYGNTRLHMCQRVHIDPDHPSLPCSCATSASYLTPPSSPLSSPPSSCYYCSEHSHIHQDSWQDLWTNGAPPPATITDAHEEAAGAPWRRDYAKSCVGTSQYMAPEVIAGECYGQECDLWSIGCILYECIYGQTPFFDNSRDRIKRKAIQWHRHLRFPHGPRLQRPNYQTSIQLPPASEEVVDLMSRLLCDKDQRLQRHDVKRHAWFGTDFDWHNLPLLPAPWMPDPCRQDLCAYFEPEDQIGAMEVKDKRARDPILRDPVCGELALGIRTNTAFLGYTFRRNVARPECCINTGLPQPCQPVAA